MWWFCCTCVLLECISKVYFCSVFLERITLEGENKGSGPPSFCCTCVLQECNWSVLPSVPQVYRSVFIRVSFKSVFLKRVTRVCYQSVFLKWGVWTESGDQDRGTFGLAASSQRRSEVWCVLFFRVIFKFGTIFIVGAGQGQESDDGAASISCFSSLSVYQWDNMR